MAASERGHAGTRSRLTPLAGIWQATEQPAHRARPWAGCSVALVAPFQVHDPFQGPAGQPRPQVAGEAPRRERRLVYDFAAAVRTDDDLRHRPERMTGRQWFHG